MGRLAKLTFKYKSDGQIKFHDPRLDAIRYRGKYIAYSKFRPTKEEKKKEKWLPYRKNPHILISNYGGVITPRSKYPVYPEPSIKNGKLNVGYFKPRDVKDRIYPQPWVSFNLGLEVCRLHVPLPKGRTLYSRRHRDGNPLNCRADNMTFYTGYRNSMKTNPYYNYDAVLNMIEKRQEMIADLRSRGIDPFDGW